MPELPETTDRYYALERLREARLTIGKGAQAMLVSRARIEKYRQTELARAQEAYLELQRTRDRTAAALGDARLALLETEEYSLSKTAGKLHMGLSGFNLMSMAYKPVYEALTGFADKLPVGDQTTNAAVIGRLMNNVKLGYYPTDPENITHILRGIRFPAGMTTNLLDPCCGCGKALRQLAQGNNCYAFGVELDECRAEEAQTRLHRVGVGSFFYSRISNEAFHVLFLNPPYLSVLNESGNRARHEKRFLAESLSHLMIGGG
ncbi:MAG: class I SAM-dependent methyltransferase, partial [Clostridia bacterium]|nr:class I SAM-dependent methyltransferase [Clostridia bacterium]